MPLKVKSMRRKSKVRRKPISMATRKKMSRAKKGKRLSSAHRRAIKEGWKKRRSGVIKRRPKLRRTM